MQISEDVIREQQRTVWNQFAPGWKKWDDFMMRFLQPMGDAIILDLALKETDTVLDVATGTGEPSLTIAGIVTKGQVVGTDLSEEMLVIAEEKAQRSGLVNCHFQPADVSSLPFADASFDAVSCRMGFMFFPNMAQAARELVRVLKPGGRLSSCVWAGPQQNHWINLLMGVINRNMQLPPPPAGAPGMFRCAQPGLITGLLEDAGLNDVNETVLSGKTIYTNADQYWTNMNEVAAPVVNALKQADQPTITKIKEEVFALLQQQYGDGELALPYSTLIIQGRKKVRYQTALVVAAR